MDFCVKVCYNAIAQKQTQEKEDDSMKKLKVGIIGCGGIATSKHMPGLSAIPEAEMVAFCDLIEEKDVRFDDIYQDEEKENDTGNNDNHDNINEQDIFE